MRWCASCARRRAGRRAGRRPVLAVLGRRAARATGSGCRTTRSTRASSSARWPRADTSAAWRWSTPAGAAGARRRRLRRGAGRDGRRGPERGRDRRRWPTPPWCCWRPGWATASRRPRPGSSRSATSTWSTRPTATAPTRCAATCAACWRSAQRREGAWRPRSSPPSPPSRRGRRRGRRPRSTRTATGWRRSGELAVRRTRRARGEIEAIAVAAAARALGRRRVARRARRPGGGGRRGAPDPYAAADTLLASVADRAGRISASRRAPEPWGVNTGTNGVRPCGTALTAADTWRTTDEEGPDPRGRGVPRLLDLTQPASAADTAGAAGGLGAARQQASPAAIDFLGELG